MWRGGQREFLEPSSFRAVRKGRCWKGGRERGREEGTRVKEVAGRQQGVGDGREGEAAGFVVVNKNDVTARMTANHACNSSSSLYLHVREDYRTSECYSKNFQSLFLFILMIIYLVRRMLSI